MEPGLVTLAKILGCLIASIGTIPLIFLLMPGSKSEEPDPDAMMTEDLTP